MQRWRRATRTHRRIGLLELREELPDLALGPSSGAIVTAPVDDAGMPITSPITGERKQAQFAEVNGCMPEPSSTTFPAARVNQ
jgi:hypothetical protein